MKYSGFKIFTYKGLTFFTVILLFSFKLQNVLQICCQVFAPWLKNFYYSEYDTYILPSNRDGVVTLGGCRQYESYSVAVSRHDTAAILERCYELLPALKDAPILREWVGLRPHRSEVRVEAEKIGKLLVRDCSSSLRSTEF